MEHLFAPLFLVLQATVLGLGLLLIVPLLAVPLRRWGKEPNRGVRVCWLVGLTLPWVLLAYWTSFNRHQEGTPNEAPPIAEVLAIAVLVAASAAGLASVALNQGARWFFLGWSLVNIWFAAVGALMCIMATSGLWL